VSGDLHDLLVRKAAKWCIRARRCTFVLLEPWHQQTEQPDVLGWQMRGWSVLVECKATRADFLRDRYRPCRMLCRDGWARGLGQERWYATGPGVVRSPSELPDRWGLIELAKHGRFRHVCTAEPLVGMPDAAILGREFGILLSALRKAHRGYGEMSWLKFNPHEVVADPVTGGRGEQEGLDIG
jgi:hypothetical protein